MPIRDSPMSAVLEKRPGGRTHDTAGKSPRLRKWLERVDDRFMGTPLDVDPHEALLHALRVTAGEVRYCEEQIRKLEESEIFEQRTETVFTKAANGIVFESEVRVLEEEFSRWVRWRNNAVDRMAKYAKMALDAGIEERQVKLAERQADLIGDYFEAVMEDLKLTSEQRRMLGPAMRRHFHQLEGSNN